MELKEGMYGMYVRAQNTLEGYIEITKIKDSCEFDGFFIDDRGRQFSTDEVIKASFNIIDLIEVGDYVNGYKVYANDGKLWIKRIDNDGTLHFTNIAYLNDISELKSIVTKEQFEAMQYNLY